MNQFVKIIQVKERVEMHINNILPLVRCKHFEQANLELKAAFGIAHLLTYFAPDCKERYIIENEIKLMYIKYNGIIKDGIVKYMRKTYIEIITEANNIENVDKSMNFLRVELEHARREWETLYPSFADEIEREYKIASRN